MNYQRYLKQGQKLVLQVQRDDAASPRTELIAVALVSLEANRALLTVPYPSESIDHYPFESGVKFTATTEAMGMGVRVTGFFDRAVDHNSFILKLEPDLQLFQRQLHPRLDCDLGVRFSRAAKTLQSMRAIWLRNLDLLYSKDAPLFYEGFKPCRTNISVGGIRFTIKPPANQGELCLILVNLQDSKPPVCAVAEIIWSCTINELAVTAGMRYINILGEDQNRIASFIKKHQ